MLYRTNAQSRALEEALRRHAVPYRLVGAVRFYDRREIRDLMAYLKLIANPSDDEAFRRAVAVPKRGLGETTIEQLAERRACSGTCRCSKAARTPEITDAAAASRARRARASSSQLIDSLRERAAEAAVDELLRELVESIKYGDYLRAEGPESAERLDNVRELITGAAEVVADELGEVGLRPLDHFLQRATLVAGVDGLSADADAVTLMTLHNAKGLEFPVVFITGLEDGLFPLGKAYDDPPLLEEERRLLYVGITRAERKLYLTHAEERRRNGELLPSRQSSFLDAIPDAMVEKRSTIKVRSSGPVGDARRRERSAATIAASAERRAVGRRYRGLRAAAVAGSRRPGSPVRGFGRRSPPKTNRRTRRCSCVGARVKHRKFGSGTIAELAGAGRDAKVKVDFDDETIGRKTLVIAQANLERGDE